MVSPEYSSNWLTCSDHRRIALMNMSEESRTRSAEEEVKSAPLKKMPDLRALREERGLTVEDIYLKTRISSLHSGSY